MSAERKFNQDVIEWTEIDFCQIPALFTSIEDEVRALRTGVALSDISHTAVVRVSGSGSDAFIDRILPCVINIKPSQMKQTVFIDSEERLFAEGYICRDENAWYILSKGIPFKEMERWLLNRIVQNEQVEISALNPNYSLISLNGPFAWELMAEVEEPEIISLPYLSFYRPDNERIIFRAGETGEFGYHQLIRADRVDAICEKIISSGEEFDLRCAGNKALEYCMLENNFFNIHREGKITHSPAELQLQWRLSYRKQFEFSEQLIRMRKRKLSRRLVAICTDIEPSQFSQVKYGNSIIGSIVNSYKNVNGPGWIGLAMIDMPYAVTGISAFTMSSVEGTTPLRTVSMPLVNNRSLYIDPQIHSYADQAEIKFPVLSSVEAPYV